MSFIDLYLNRIQVKGTNKADQQALFSLHRAHIFNVPFENLDIYMGRRFTMEKEQVFEKVVQRQRGGFCYELNYLFSLLLDELGFSTSIISASVCDDTGRPGPPYDHMAILVHIRENSFLADVGFGDLFLTPVNMDGTVQSDGRSYFRILSHETEGFILQQSKNGADFSDKYIFRTEIVKPEQFHSSCQQKQSDPDSHFVKNRICTMATVNGRVSIVNNRLIRHMGYTRFQRDIKNETDFRKILLDRFKIRI